MVTKALVVCLSIGAAGTVALTWSPGFRSLVAGQVPRQFVVMLNGLRFGYQVDHSVRIRAPDGIILAASLYLPRKQDKRVATILVRHPYGRLLHGEGLRAAGYFAARGYAVLVEDLRGTYDSGGEFLPYKHATADGVATLDWVVSQPWSNGRVGTFGCSALGETQFSLARARHPAHRAMVASGAGGGMGLINGDAGYFGVFEGGILQLASAFGWFSEHGAGKTKRPLGPVEGFVGHLSTLPVASMVDRTGRDGRAFRFFALTPLGSEAWQQLDYFSDQNRSDVPALVINTWGDQTVGASIALAQHHKRNAPEVPHSLTLAPGIHCQHEKTGESGKFGSLQVSNANQPYMEWALRWFDHYLRDLGDTPQWPRYRYYIVGGEEWRSADQWPPKEASLQRLYLGSGGRANGAHGDGLLTEETPTIENVDSLRNDPKRPVPSRGGPICCTGNSNESAGPADQREVESRDDVLVYTTAPLKADLVIAGPLRAKLAVSSSSVDTDFVARLCHVRPNGLSTGIQEGALRLRYRDGVTFPRPLEPDRITRVTIDMRSIAYSVPAGHRLRLTISGTSFPRLARNLNSLGDPALETSDKISTNRIHHGPDSTSWIELPVLPNAGAKTTK